MGEQNELRNRNIHVSAQDVPINVPINVPLNQNERESQIIKAMQSDSTITAKTLSEQLGVSDKTIKRDIASLKERGIIDRQGSNKIGNWIIK